MEAAVALVRLGAGNAKEVDAASTVAGFAANKIVACACVL
jgi:hypothetical protein